MTENGVDREPQGGSSAAADSSAPFRCVLLPFRLWGRFPSEWERGGGSQRCRKGEESGDAREGGPPAANVDDGVPKLRQMPCDGREEEEEDRGVSG